MDRTQKKRLFQALLGIGVVLLVLSLLLEGRVPDALGGMLCGVGSGLSAMAGSTMRRVPSPESSEKICETVSACPAEPRNPLYTASNRRPR